MFLHYPVTQREQQTEKMQLAGFKCLRGSMCFSEAACVFYPGWVVAVMCWGELADGKELAGDQIREKIGG